LCATKNQRCVRLLMWEELLLLGVQSRVFQKFFPFKDDETPFVFWNGRWTYHLTQRRQQRPELKRNSRVFKIKAEVVWRKEAWGRTSPRWDSPIGPLVSGLAMMIRTPGRICSGNRASAFLITQTLKVKEKSKRRNTSSPFQTPWAAGCEGTPAPPGGPCRHTKDRTPKPHEHGPPNHMNTEHHGVQRERSNISPYLPVCRKWNHRKGIWANKK